MGGLIQSDLVEGCFSVSYLPLLDIRDHDSPNWMIGKPQPMTQARATIPQIQSTSHRHELLSHVSPRQVKKPTLLQSSLHHNPRLKHLRAKPGLIGADWHLPIGNHEI